MSWLRQLSQLSAKELFELSALGTIITVLGSLLATFLKDFLFARAFESWKAERTLRSIYQKYRDPLLLSTVELVGRLDEILYWDSSFLDLRVLESKPERMLRNDTSDKFYQRYKLVSAVYRLSAWFGWTELQRRELTFLDSGRRRTNEEFEARLRAMRLAIADGGINEAPDWNEWTDSLIFREEQRAIGESMIDPAGKAVIGYGLFCERFESMDDSMTKRWCTRAMTFLIGVTTAAHVRDFQRPRCLLLVLHAIGLLQSLDTRRVTPKHRELEKKVREDLARYPVSAWALEARSGEVARR